MIVMSPFRMRFRAASPYVSGIRSTERAALTLVRSDRLLAFRSDEDRVALAAAALAAAFVAEVLADVALPDAAVALAAAAVAWVVAKVT
jgi:hypothetical protein